MKRNIFILIQFIFITSIYSQQLNTVMIDEKILDFPDPKIRQNNADIIKKYNQVIKSGQVIDSIYLSYEVRNSNYRKKEIISTRNNKGQINKLIQYYYDNDNESWIAKTKLEIEYFKNDTIKKLVTYDWNNQTTQWEENISLNYNLSGQLIEEYNKKTILIGLSIYDINPTRLIYEYNDEGLMVSLLVQKLDSILTGSWQNSRRNIYEYDSNNHLKIMINQFWNEILNDWVSHSKEINTYNSKGFLDHKEFFCLQNETWNLGEKYINTYNQLNKIEVQEHYVYSCPTGDLSYAYREEFEYDEKGNNTLYVKRKKLDLENSWTNLMKKIQVYNSNYQLAEVICEGWSLNSWELVSKENYFYTSFNEVSEYIYSRWDENNEIWEYVHAYENEFNSDDNMIIYLNKEWNPQLNNWEYISKIEYTYDENERSILQINYQWNTEGSVWQETEKWECLYNVYGNRIYELKAIWNGDLVQWSDINRTDYFYQEFVLNIPDNISNEFIVGPNPSNGIFNILFKNYSGISNKVFVYNLTGKLLLTKIVEHEGEIDLSGFGNGVYLLKTDDNLVKKLIVK